MTHIYYGNGKGKTTAATGLAVRAAGRGIPVCFVQFLKDGSSGEISVLRNLPGVCLIHPPISYGFTRNMTEEQKRKTAEICESLLAQVKLRMGAPCSTKPDAEDVVSLIVLDEVLHAERHGFVSEDELLSLIELAGEKNELVLTGAQASEGLLARADYVTHFVKEKHPFDEGVPARTGIER